jgi:CMP-N-acetylneuraminic acid synthetase
MQPRQNLPDVYIRNGAIYLINRNTLLDNNQLIGKKCAGYIMNSRESINIDTLIDLKIAKLFLEKE